MVRVMDGRYDVFMVSALSLRPLDAARSGHNRGKNDLRGYIAWEDPRNSTLQ